MQLNTILDQNNHKVRIKKFKKLYDIKPHQIITKIKQKERKQNKERKSLRNYHILRMELVST